MGTHLDPTYKVKHAKLPRSRYVQQKAHAKARGIPFTLTFEQWWAIWEESGQWENRGKRPGQFCMARNNDAGGYTPGNVSIQRVGANLAEQLDTGKHTSVKLAPGDLDKLLALSGSKTQKELADLFGISQPYVSRLLRGERGKYLG